MSPHVRRLSRRQFLHFGVLAASSWAAIACGGQPTQAPATSASSTIAAPATAVASTPVATSTPAKLLRNENREGFYIRYYQPFPAVDVNTWQLEVKGLVEAPRTFTLQELMALPQSTMNARMKCVECWSARTDWTGFTYQTLADIVKPKAEARFIRVECADGYWESAEIASLDPQRPTFITQIKGAPLEPEHGAPLRLLFPPRYGYKSAKVITSIEWKTEGEAGYWSTVGPYTIGGNIEAGRDSPLDLQGSSRPIKGGEITEY
jgi:methionine sulfoxide reductase catalytic subunit